MFGCVVEVGIFFILILVNWLRWVWCGQCWAFSQRWNSGEGVFVIVWRIFEANLRPFKTKRPPTFSGINHSRPPFTLLLPFAFTHRCFCFTLKSMLLYRVCWFFWIEWFWGNWVSLFRREKKKMLALLFAWSWFLMVGFQRHLMVYWFVVFCFTSFLDCAGWIFVLQVSLVMLIN